MSTHWRRRRAVRSLVRKFGERGTTFVFCGPHRVYAEGDETRLPGLAASLVQRKPDLIFANTNQEARALLAATRTIPVVFGSAVEPVENGMVASLARPGGNATGVASLGPEYGSKRMQLLQEILPRITRVGVLSSPTGARELKLIEDAAGAGVRVIPAKVSGPDDLDAALASFGEARVEALLLTQISFIGRRAARKRIVDFAAKQRIPVVGQRPDIVEDGALMSYSANLQEQIRRATQLADKVLKGTQPAEIPVEQPIRFELLLNLKTARALDLMIPQSIRVQATKMIE